MLKHGAENRRTRYGSGENKTELEEPWDASGHAKRSLPTPQQPTRYSILLQQAGQIQCNCHTSVSCDIMWPTEFQTGCGRIPYVLSNNAEEYTGG